MITAAAISKAVTERLALYLTEVEVREVQNRETFKLTSPVATIITHYVGSENTNNRSVSFGVYVVTRFRDEAYKYVEAVRMVLNGYQIDGAYPILYRGDEFANEDQGIWQYNLNFSVITGCSPIPDSKLQAALSNL